MLSIAVNKLTDILFHIPYSFCLNYKEGNKYMPSVTIQCVCQNIIFIR